ncbi:hypothetical protein EVJ58_g8683 [Rhodofomes roseus]|uniref:Uncharacterized protein n=1 Tax=Rhodofomes roseus TaxID=34475 RepID=A0A4Y9XXA2_9APHY|nr:hypothetical protein EVJ58_g8683 [Rhodofomes roseus]
MSAVTINTLRTAARRVPAVPKPGMAVALRFYSGSMHEHDPDTIEKEKHRNLTGKQHKTSAPHEKTAPGWNEYLASASEAAVKADQSHGEGDGGTAAMQQNTVTHVKRRYHEEDSPVPNPQEQTSSPEQGTNTSHMAHGENVHAVYERDEVSGPLGGAGDENSVEVEEVTKFTSTKTPRK